MLSIRIIATSAALIASAVLASAVGAAAQTAQPAAAPGKPIQLLHIVERPDKAAKPKSHVKTVAKSPRRRVAAKAAHHVPPPAKAAVITTVAAVPAIDPPADPTLAFAAPIPDVVTVAGQAVQVATPDDVNDIDRAASTPDELARKDVAAADAAMVPAAAAPAPVAAVATAAPQAQGATTSVDASWLAQALAALGGAIAAASAAWFMIGSTPQRLHG